MANVIIVLILVVAVAYGIYNYVHHLNHGGGCCGEHDAPARKVKAADTNKSHYLHRLVMGVDGMTCQNCQRHVENALNAMTDTLAEADLSAQKVTVWTKADADEDAIRQAIRDAGYLPLRTTEKE
jgi:copper chaperone CopZ